MRLSRWGRSPYETEDDIALEEETLRGVVTLAPEGADAEIVVVHSKIPMGPEEHGRAPSLRLLVTTTSGTDHIDLGHFRERGVVVARLPEARRDAVVDSTLGMLIWGMRRFGDLQESSRRNEWARGELPALKPVGLKGARIGVVGLGLIGRRVAEVLQSFGAEVWGLDPRGLPEGMAEASLPEMLGHCDGVSFHCSLNPSTNGLVGKTELDGAHPDLVLVNTARGAVLDVRAAVRQVELGRLGAVAVDVFPEEPWRHMAAGHPRILFLPHAAGYHTGLAEGVRSGLRAAVDAFVRGCRPPHEV